MRVKWDYFAKAEAFYYFNRSELEEIEEKCVKSIPIKSSVSEGSLEVFVTLEDGRTVKVLFTKMIDGSIQIHDVATE